MRLLLLSYPWLELLSLIQLGVETNALIALGWVVLMMLIGGALLRRAGTAALFRLRAAQQQGYLQQHLFVDDMAVAVAALLLIIPGLLSDFFAVMVLIGPLRRGLSRWVTPKRHTFEPTGEVEARMSTHQRGRGQPQERVTLDGEYRRVDDPDTEHR